MPADTSRRRGNGRERRVLPCIIGACTLAIAVNIGMHVNAFVGTCHRGIRAPSVFSKAEAAADTSYEDAFSSRVVQAKTKKQDEAMEAEQKRKEKKKGPPSVPMLGNFMEGRAGSQNSGNNFLSQIEWGGLQYVVYGIGLILTVVFVWKMSTMGLWGTV